mmetsp:Transcript_8007/g.7197  ORF Transcript_8007/g.7197 Transcript_8007/m.7197 type:complete len:166 (+) Transcript_8007:212-709(+)
MAKEWLGGSDYVNYADRYEFTMYKRTIRPLYCDEEPALSDVAYQTRCVNRDEKLTIYLKEATINLMIWDSLTVENIVFDGIEDIRNYNHVDDPFYCLYTRIRCCQEGDQYSFSQGTGITCSPPWYLDLSGDAIYGSFFNFYDEDGPTAPNTHYSLTLTNSGLRNF